MIAVERVVAIVPSRKSYVATFRLDGSLVEALRVGTHGREMLSFLEKQPGASVHVQSPLWKLDALGCVEDLANLHGLAETAIRWAAVAEVLDVPCRGVPRFAWLNDLSREGLIRRDAHDRVQFHELARQHAPEAPRELSEAICLGVWALRQFPRLRAYELPVVAVVARFRSPPRSPSA